MSSRLETPEAPREIVLSRRGLEHAQPEVERLVDGEDEEEVLATESRQRRFEERHVVAAPLLVEPRVRWSWASTMRRRATARTS